MLTLSYPHVDKQENQPARLQRSPRIRVAQIVIDQEINQEWEHFQTTTTQVARSPFYTRMKARGLM
ncbi:MAG: hypothetical protein ACFBSC_17825 [Microcoleaceae cyanobacterium]